jgi:hypothetical protein
MVYAVQVAGYEQLLRRVMLKAPQAALLSMACFSFKVTHKGLPGAYWKTAEDIHAVIAKRLVQLTSACCSSGIGWQASVTGDGVVCGIHPFAVASCCKPN